MKITINLSEGTIKDIEDRYIEYTREKLPANRGSREYREWLEDQIHRYLDTILG